MPYDFGNGIIWKNVINENDLARVNIYDVSQDAISYVMEINKKSIINELRLIGPSAYKVSKDNEIVIIYRYFFGTLLLKEVKILPSEFNFISVYKGEDLINDLLTALKIFENQTDKNLVKIPEGFFQK